MSALDDRPRGFDDHALAAVGWLGAFLDEYAEELIQLGHHRQHYYRDRLMYDYDRDRLAIEIAGLLADAIVCAARRLEI